MPRLTRSLIAAVGVFAVVLSTTVASATTLTKEIDEPDADEFAVDGARRADRDRPRWVRGVLGACGDRAGRVDDAAHVPALVRDLHGGIYKLGDADTLYNP